MKLIPSSLPPPPGLEVLRPSARTLGRKRRREKAALSRRNTALSKPVELPVYSKDCMLAHRPLDQPRQPQKSLPILLQHGVSDEPALGEFNNRRSWSSKGMSADSLMIEESVAQIQKELSAIKQFQHDVEGRIEDLNASFANHCSRIVQELAQMERCFGKRDDLDAVCTFTEKLALKWAESADHHMMLKSDIGNLQRKIETGLKESETSMERHASKMTSNVNDTMKLILAD